MCRSYSLSLKNDGKGGIMVDPDAKLEEELIIQTDIRNDYLEYISWLDRILS
jgi:hypothetical protein